MYDVSDLHGFVQYSFYTMSKKNEEERNEHIRIINELLDENKKLKKENQSLGQQNAVLAALVRTTSGINYKSDYE